LAPLTVIGEDALAAGAPQGVQLQVERLILRGDPEVADEHATHVV
jgi:hypothetical protein